MKFSITTVATLLHFVASSLHQKKLEDKSVSDENIITDTTVSLTWRKKELAPLVNELREMDIYGGSFTSAVKMDKILLSGDDTSFDHEYNKRLAKRIITFVTEAKIYDLKIGNAARILIRSLKSNMDNNLISLLMESDNMEVKAAVLSVYGNKKDIWETYYSKIKEDEELQKRLLELIDLRFESSEYILMNWGASLSSEDENIEIKCWIGSRSGRFWAQLLHVHVKYSLQHLKMSPKQVVIEFLNIGNLIIYIENLVKDYEPTGTSADIGVELAIVLFNSSFPYMAQEILSKNKWHLLPEEDKLRLCSIYRDANWFLLTNHFNLKTINQLDFSDAKLVEKLLRSGNLYQFSLQVNRIFGGTFGKEYLMKIGEITALLLLEVSRNSTKYSWVSIHFSTFLFIISNVIDSCKLTFDTKNSKPVVAALDLVFGGGEIVDLSIRYFFGNDDTGLLPLLMKEKTRGRYGRDILCRFAFKKWIGDYDYYNFRKEDGIKSIIETYVMSNDMDSLSDVDLWKIQMEHLAKLRSNRDRLKALPKIISQLEQCSK